MCSRDLSRLGAARLPGHRLIAADPYPATLLVHAAEVDHGETQARVRRFAIEGQGFFFVSVDAPALEISLAEVVLGLCMALFGGPAIPRYGCRIILRG